MEYIRNKEDKNKGCVFCSKSKQKNDVRGLEPQKNLVQECIAKGLPVIEGDAEKELVQFPKKSFDYVVLSQTLQAFFNPEEVLEQLLPRYVEMEVYHAVLEAMASEHSARMVAMKNATDAANDLIDDLTLKLNKARQEAITSEMLDIVGGVEALA